MIITVLIGLIIGFSDGFRGPHHPRSAVSHHHYAPQKNIKITQDAELLQDATHLKEDMGPMADQLDFSNMTEQEIEFHYFKTHDVDSNAKLDGLEILHAIQHTLHENRVTDREHGNLSEETLQIEYQDDFPWIIGGDFTSQNKSKIKNGEIAMEPSFFNYRYVKIGLWSACSMTELIDRVLKEDDLDNDGYLGYIEYVLGRQRDHVAQANRNTNQANSKLKIGK